MGMMPRAIRGSVVHNQTREITMKAQSGSMNDLPTLFEDLLWLPHSLVCIASMGIGAAVSYHWSGYPDAAAMIAFPFIFQSTIIMLYIWGAATRERKKRLKRTAILNASYFLLLLMATAVAVPVLLSMDGAAEGNHRYPQETLWLGPILMGIQGLVSVVTAIGAYGLFRKCGK